MSNLPSKLWFFGLQSLSQGRHLYTAQILLLQKYPTISWRPKCHCKAKAALLWYHPSLDKVKNVFVFSCKQCYETIMAQELFRNTNSGLMKLWRIYFFFFINKENQSRTLYWRWKQPFQQLALLLNNNNKYFKNLNNQDEALIFPFVIAKDETYSNNHIARFAKAIFLRWWNNCLWKWQCSHVLINYGIVAAEFLPLGGDKRTAPGMCAQKMTNN